MRKANKIAPDVPKGIHLNIGCGAKIWEGFINIDFPGNWSKIKPDIECDVRTLPFDDYYADSVWAIHILEHFYRWETKAILREWARVLKPGGLMVIEVPCLDKVIKQFIRCIDEKVQLNEQATMWRLYGDPDYKDPTMVHKWCFPVGELLELMRIIGLHDVKYSEPEYHHPKCDMRISGIK